MWCFVRLLMSSMRSSLVQHVEKQQRLEKVNLLRSLNTKFDCSMQCAHAYMHYAGYCSKRSLVGRCGFDPDSRASKYYWELGEVLLNISQECTLQLKRKRRGCLLSFENNFPFVGQLDMYPVYLAIPFTFLIEWRQVMDLISSGIAAEQKHEDTLFHRYQVPQKLCTRLLFL